MCVVPRRVRVLVLLMVVVLSSGCSRNVRSPVSSGVPADVSESPHLAPTTPLVSRVAPPEPSSGAAAVAAGVVLPAGLVSTEVRSVLFGYRGPARLDFFGFAKRVDVVASPSGPVAVRWLSNPGADAVMTSRVVARAAPGPLDDRALWREWVRFDVADSTVAGVFERFVGVWLRNDAAAFPHVRSATAFRWSSLAPAFEVLSDNPLAGAAAGAGLDVWRFAETSSGYRLWCDDLVVCPQGPAAIELIVDDARMLVEIRQWFPSGSRVDVGVSYVPDVGFVPDVDSFPPPGVIAGLEQVAATFSG